MGTVQYFLPVLLSAQLVFNFPMQPDRTYMEGSKRCTECPAGEFQKSCTQCKPCPHGTYTKEWNREPTCLKCFRDCSPRYHMKVVQNCTRTTPLRCVCEPGFRCMHIDDLGNCRDCEKGMDTTAALVTLNKDKHTTSNPKPAHTGTGLAAILGPVVFIGCMALMILFCIYQPREETCFRQIIAKLCNEAGPKATRKTKESTHQFPRDSFSAKQQTAPLSAANLGPVHVHNPGTVIFSLLSQFTGQVGPTVQCEKRAERVSNEEEDERDCPVFHPMPSPSIHLSKEERSSETGDVFFPSQEQGKDYHVSKEEVL